MKNKINLAIFSMFVSLISLSLASALIIESAEIDELFPGQASPLSITLKNTLEDDIEDVSFIIDLEDSIFTTLGSSEDSEEDIREGKKENFNFILKAPSNAKPGDYNIPYEITYTDWNDNKKTKTGSFGVTVSAKTELSYGIELENNIVGEKGRLSFKVINSGLGDIGFVSVKFISTNGLEVISSSEEYIGTVRSDDFEIATFDVLYKKESASLTARLKYKDFDNNEEIKTIILPVKVYSREKALELGLIEKSSTPIYIGIVVLVAAWLIYRKIRKSRKNKKT